MRLILGILVSVLSSATALSGQAEENTLDGWGELKFGMTVEQAREAEPRLKDYGAREELKSDAGAVEIGGEPFTLETYFYHAERLSKISLFWDGQGRYNDPESCKAFYDMNARMLVKKYGTFDAPPEERDISTLPDVKEHVVMNTSDGSGKYEKFVYKEDGRKVLELSALKQISDASLSLKGMFWRERSSSERNVCWLFVDFMKDKVSPLPLPEKSKDEF